MALLAGMCNDWRQRQYCQRDQIVRRKCLDMIEALELKKIYIMSRISASNPNSCHCIPDSFNHPTIKSYLRLAIIQLRQSTTSGSSSSSSASPFSHPVAIEYRHFSINLNKIEKNYYERISQEGIRMSVPLHSETRIRFCLPCICVPIKIIFRVQLNHT